MTHFTKFQAFFSASLVLAALQGDAAEAPPIPGPGNDLGAQGVVHYIQDASGAEPVQTGVASRSAPDGFAFPAAAAAPVPTSAPVAAAAELSASTAAANPQAEPQAADIGSGAEAPGARPREIRFESASRRYPRLFDVIRPSAAAGTSASQGE